MRVPSDGFLLQSLREIREKTTALYQQLQDQDRVQILSLDREITRRLRQIDGMILSLDPLYGVQNSMYSRDLFRILNALRADLGKIQKKVQGDEVFAANVPLNRILRKNSVGQLSLYSQAEEF